MKENRKRLASLLLALCMWVPEHVLFLSVEGNSAVPEAKILEAAESAGIRIGISRRAIRNENVKNRLLSAIP